MLYVTRYYQISITFTGEFHQLSPDQHDGDLLMRKHGGTVVINSTSYRLVGVGQLKRIDHPSKPGAGAMLSEWAVVAEDEWPTFADVPGLYVGLK